MTQEEVPGPVNVQLACCSVCDLVYLASPRRDNSPCHGADPLLLIATLTYQPDGHASGIWGPELPAVDAAASEIIPFAVQDPVEGDEDDEDEEEEERAEHPRDPLLTAIWDFIDAAEPVVERLNQAFLDYGLPPESAATAAGRIDAVRQAILAFPL